MPALALTPFGSTTTVSPPMASSASSLHPAATPAGAHVLVQGVTKEFLHGGRTLAVLRGLNFEIKPGEIVSVVGASGAGKSTLLHLLGTIELPSAGRSE